MKPIAGSRVRCAIYTRKSSEEGLEQSFNSLQAQREACEAYIASQRHEGWHALSKEYDDGGFSGGNMNRPALKQLLEDIAAGLIDTIVVYKIDRLHALSQTSPGWSKLSTRESTTSQSATWLAIPKSRPRLRLHRRQTLCGNVRRIPDLSPIRQR